MPLKRCKLPDGSQGWKYGDSGKCYKKKADAIKQGVAISGPEGFKKEMKKSKGRRTEIIDSITEQLKKGGEASGS